MGEIGKTDNGIVAVTTHLYDGKKSVPLDIEIYQPASSLAEGKEDKEFKKKPEIAIDLIDRSLIRGYRPKIVLIDAGYGNNTNFLKALEERKLKYLGGLAKNRKVIIEKEGGVEETIQLEQLAKSRLRQIAGSQPFATSATLELLSRSIEDAQSTVFALEATVQEIKKDWSLP